MHYQSRCEFLRFTFAQPFQYIALTLIFLTVKQIEKMITTEVFVDSSTKSASDNNLDAIAIIRLAHKLPRDITSAESLWKLLLDRRSTMTEIPKNRWNIDAFYNTHGNRPSTVLSVQKDSEVLA